MNNYATTVKEKEYNTLIAQTFFTLWNGCLFFIYKCIDMTYPMRPVHNNTRNE